MIILRRDFIRKAAASAVGLFFTGSFVRGDDQDEGLSKIPDTVRSKSFVTRSGSKLMLDGRIFRFAGANLDWLVLANDKFLHFNDEEIGTATESYYPSRGMIDNAFETVVRMNGTVARVWSAGCQGTPLSIEPELGKFNERALQQLDYVLDSASRHNIRLILPFCDNWDYYVGGVKQFSKWRGGADFYNDCGCKADYKAYIDVIVNRKNSINNIEYKNDPTILAWESGNELNSTLEWDREIAAYIKSIDNNHLYALGKVGSMSKMEEWLAIPEVDVVQMHYYRVHNIPWEASKDASIASDAGKVFVVGEYGWDPKNFTLEELKGAMEEIETNPDITGDLFWALRGRQDSREFMTVPGAGGDWWALYYPGRTTGDSNKEQDMKDRVKILSNHADNMSKSQK